jgi:hypothetical protein
VVEMAWCDEGVKGEVHIEFSTGRKRKYNGE